MKLPTPRIWKKESYWKEALQCWLNQRVSTNPPSLPFWTSNSMPPLANRIGHTHTRKQGNQGWVVCRRLTAVCWETQVKAQTWDRGQAGKGHHLSWVPGITVCYFQAGKGHHPKASFRGSLKRLTGVAKALERLCGPKRATAQPLGTT